MSKIKAREYRGVNARFIRKLLVKRAASRVYITLNDEPEREVPRNALGSNSTITVRGIRSKTGNIGFNVAMEWVYAYLRCADATVGVHEDGSVHIRLRERGLAQ